MKIIIIKYNRISITETFIRDYAKNSKFDNLLLHRHDAVVYTVNDFKSDITILEKLYCKVMGLSQFERRLQIHIKKYTPNLILAEYGTTAVNLFQICEKNNIPLVVHFHGYDAHNREILEENKEAYDKMLKYSTAIIVVSQKMRDSIIMMGAEPSKIFLNPCGVDLKNNKKINQPKGKYFISIGRFVEKKAPYITILAFNEYVKSYPNAKLIMIGDGNLLNSCKDLSESLGLMNNIVFKGGLSHQEVLETLQGAFAFLQHSIEAQNGDSEGSPVSIVEASGYGIPVISTMHAGIIDSVQNYQTGILVREKDYHSMAKAMVEISENPALYKKLSLNGIDYIKNNYTLKKYTERLDDILSWCCKKSSIKPPLNPLFLEKDNI